MNLTIQDVSFHRNGIGGMGFYVVLFRDNEEKEDMIAALFDETGYCAVFAIDELVKKNIKFAHGNSWRGDVYAGELRPLVNKWVRKGMSGDST